MLRRTLLALLLLLAAAPAFARSDAAPLRVVVSIPPLVWPVEALLKGDGAPIPATVSLLLRPGVSEHGFELTPSQIADVQRADLVVMAGYGLEGRLTDALTRKPRSDRQTLTLEGLVEPIVADHDHSKCEHGHDHGQSHDHAAGLTDPHLWLDPVAMRAFIDRLEAALRERLATLPEARRAPALEALTSRAAAARAVCDEIHAQYQTAIVPLTRRAIVTHHNAYAYLCRRYGLEVAAVIRPTETAEPTPGDIMTAVKALRERRAAAVFVEPQFPAGAAKRIADTARVRLESIDPLGDGDWPALMRANLTALVRGLSAEAPAPTGIPAPR